MVVLPEPGTPSSRYIRFGVRPPPKTSSRPSTPVPARRSEDDSSGGELEAIDGINLSDCFKKPDGYRWSTHDPTHMRTCDATSLSDLACPTRMGNGCRLVTAVEHALACADTAPGPAGLAATPYFQRVRIASRSKSRMPSSINPAFTPSSASEAKAMTGPVR